MHFDVAVIGWINHFAERAPAMNALMAWLADAELFKGAVLMAVLWWLWFAGLDGATHYRQAVLGALAAAFFALLAARGLSLMTPFRPRPMFVFPPPFDADPRWEQVNSFPSDHAALFCAIAASLFAASRRIGLLSLAYVLLVICLPRIYLGLHYVSDVAAGAALGIIVAGICYQAGVPLRLAPPARAWARRYPAAFYTAAFLLTYQIATLFTDLRTLRHLLVEFIRRWLLA